MLEKITEEVGFAIIAVASHSNHNATELVCSLAQVFSIIRFGSGEIF